MEGAVLEHCVDEIPLFMQITKTKMKVFERKREEKKNTASQRGELSAGNNF